MTKNRWLGHFYRLALALRGLDGLLDLMFSGLIYFSGSRALTNLLLRLLSEELLEDPHDWLANQLINFAQSLSVEMRLFIALYLAVNGLLKVILSVSLWLKKQWAYPVALVLLAGFVFYQLYRLAHGFSWLVTILLLVDIFIGLMVFYHYRSTVKK